MNNVLIVVLFSTLCKLSTKISTSFEYLSTINWMFYIILQNKLYKDSHVNYSILVGLWYASKIIITFYHFWAKLHRNLILYVHRLMFVWTYAYSTSANCFWKSYPIFQKTAWTTHVRPPAALFIHSSRSRNSGVLFRSIVFT